MTTLSTSRPGVATSDGLTHLPSWRDTVMIEISAQRPSPPNSISDLLSPLASKWPIVQIKKPVSIGCRIHCFTRDFPCATPIRYMAKIISNMFRWRPQTGGS